MNLLNNETIKYSYDKNNLLKNMNKRNFNQTAKKNILSWHNTLIISSSTNVCFENKVYYNDKKTQCTEMFWVRFSL